MGYPTAKHFLRWRSLSWVGAIASCLVSSLAQSVSAAEQLQFAYGPIEATLAVEDIEAFAQTGKVSSQLSGITNRFSPEQLQSLRDFLTFRLEAPTVMVSQFTYGPVGSRLVERMGQVIRSDSLGNNGFHAIRSALILASADNEGLSLLNFIHHFPLETMQIDLPLTLQILAENQRIYQQRDAVITELRQTAEAQPESAWQPPRLGLEEPGDYRWTQESFEFRNPARPDALAQVSADLYLPIAGQQPLPEPISLIVISHGVASNRATLAYLAKHWASHGYAVVVPEHLETSTERFIRFLTGKAGAPDPAELIYRPLDIGAVLDHL